MAVEALIRDVRISTESGFVRPETWDEFVKVLEERPRIGRMPRSEYTESVYKLYTWGLDQKGVDVQDGVLLKMGDKRVAMIRNEFEYDWLYEKVDASLVKEGKRIGHFCLWNRDGAMTDEQVRSMVGEVFPDVDRWASFVNKPKDQSVPEIWHTHIFVVMDMDDERLNTRPHRLDLGWTWLIDKNDVAINNLVLEEVYGK